MQLKIEAVGQQKTSQYGEYFGVKAGGVWYNVQGPRQDLKGKTFEAEVKDSGKFKWAKLLKEAGAPAPSGNGASHGAVAWDDYEKMADMAHSMATRLEPGDPAARAAILNTVMIAYSNGKIALPKEEPPPDAPPFDDDIPF